MKSIQLILFIIILLNFKGYTQTVGNQIGIEVLRGEEWLLYKDMLIQLKEKNKIDTIDAANLKIFSSNSFVAFEQTTDSIVNQHGKIEEENIRFVFKISSLDNGYLMILTSHLGYCHIFKYNISKRELFSIPNRGSIVLSGAEILQMEEFNNSTINFYAKNPYNKKGDWIKYFTLDLKSEVFAHSRNCRFINNKEECEFFWADGSKSNQ